MGWHRLIGSLNREKGTFSIAEIQPFRASLPPHSGVEEETEGETKQSVRKHEADRHMREDMQEWGGMGWRGMMRVD